MSADIFWSIVVVSCALLPACSWNRPRPAATAASAVPSFPSALPSPEPVIDWSVVDCTGGQWLQPGSAAAREIGLALQRGLAHFPDFQPLFFPQIYDPWGSPGIYLGQDWAVVYTGFQWMEGAGHLLFHTPDGYQYRGYFVAGGFVETPIRQQLEEIARQWPLIPPQVIACFPWAKMFAATPTPVGVGELMDADCSLVEWIDPQSEQGRKIGERLLSLGRQPKPVEETFTQVGPIEKVGDWIVYQAVREVATLYVLGPTTEGTQFFGEGWMRMASGETLADVQIHLRRRLPETPPALIACLQPEPWLFGQ